MMERCYFNMRNTGNNKNVSGYIFNLGKFTKISNFLRQVERDSISVFSILEDANGRQDMKREGEQGDNYCLMIQWIGCSFEGVGRKQVKASKKKTNVISQKTR